MDCKVTITVPTYNHINYIDDCFKGLLSQAGIDADIIIIDDASTDGTSQYIEEHIEELRQKFRKVTYVQHVENCGNLSKIANELFSYVTGEYFCGVSGDDILCEGAVAEMIKILDEHRECDVAYSNMRMIGDEYHYGDTCPSELFIRDQTEGMQKNAFKRLLFCNFIPAPSVIMRTSVVEKFGLHDENIFAEDYEYWLRISRCVQFYFYNKPLVLYRRSLSSATNYAENGGEARMLKMMKSDYQTRKKYFDSVPEEYKKICLGEFYNTYYKECVNLSSSAGLNWLVSRMEEEGVEMDARQSDYKKISERLGKEGEILCNWILKKDNPNYLKDYFESHSIKSAAIYGYSRLGKLLEKEILKTEISLSCIIDRKGEVLQTSVPVYSSLKEIPKVDAIIVAPIGLYSEIANHKDLPDGIKVFEISEIFDL